MKEIRMTNASLFCIHSWPQEENIIAFSLWRSEKELGQGRVKYSDKYNEEESLFNM